MHPNFIKFKESKRSLLLLIVLISICIISIVLICKFLNLEEIKRNTLRIYQFDFLIIFFNLIVVFLSTFIWTFTIIFGTPLLKKY